MVQYFKVCLCVGIIACMASCADTPEPHPNGTHFSYYLNTKNYLQSQLAIFTPKGYKYTELVHNGKSFDTNYNSINQIDWQPYIDAFLKINIQDTSNNMLYKMSQNIDTNTSILQATYTPLYTNLPLKHMVLNMNSLDSYKIVMLYAEYEQHNMWSSNTLKLTYNAGQSILLMHTSKPWWGKATTNISKVVMQAPTVSPSLDIITP
jgi:hypothetical protein